MILVAVVLQLPTALQQTCSRICSIWLELPQASYTLVMGVNVTLKGTSVALNLFLLSPAQHRAGIPGAQGRK